MCCFEMESFIDSIKNPKTLAFSFWVSVILLIIISLLKYFMSKECVRKDWGNIILEFPIDVCLIIITYYNYSCNNWLYERGHIRLWSCIGSNFNYNIFILLSIS